MGEVIYILEALEAIVYSSKDYLIRNLHILNISTNNMTSNPIEGSLPVGRRGQGLGGAAAEEVLVEERRGGRRPRRGQEGPGAGQQPVKARGQGTRPQVQVMILSTHYSCDVQRGHGCLIKGGFVDLDLVWSFHFILGKVKLLKFDRDGITN